MSLGISYLSIALPDLRELTVLRHTRRGEGDKSLLTARCLVLVAPPTCSKKVPALSTVCNDLLSTYSLTTDQLYKYNDDVSEDCTKSGLVIGQEVGIFLL